MRRSVLVIGGLVLGIGCGRLDFEPEDPAEGAFEADGGVAPMMRAPDLIPSLASPSSTEGHPTVTPDLRELYFTSDRGGNGDIWRSVRPSPDAPWGPPSLVAELSSTSTEGNAELSSDGLTVWIASARPGGLGGLDLWTATRARLGDPWSVPVHVPVLSSAGEDSGATPDASQRFIVFTSTRSGGLGRRDLWLATRASSADPWGTPVPLAEINTAREDADPFLSPDGLSLWFDSNRDTGDYRELFVARRTALDQPFGPPERVSRMDGMRADADPWLSLDGHYFVFSSSRTGDDEILDAYF